ncbi:MAG TPA: UbiA family prenyltransferase, partial [Gemmatimonadales bacterium]|nr:UbiA family prenyltransferase [Gemmatimonadales bacterium]
MAAAPARHRWAYATFGKAAPYLLHLRPVEWPIMAAHTLLGYLLAVGLVGAGAGKALPAAALGLLLWVVCLNGGTLAINSAFDNDEGDIAYLRAPPKPPRHLFAWGLGLMLLGQALAFELPRPFVLAYAACVVMSVLYSVPPFRLKAVAGADWVINMWGFGTLTPFAGWASTGRPLDLPHALVLLGFCPLFAALYPLTQIYQVEEDTRRGDRTLVIRMGVGRSLGVAIGATLLAFLLFGWSLELIGGGTPPKVAGLAVALAAWLGVLVPWARRHPSMSAALHQRGMYLALGAWAVTDVVVA